MTARGDLRLPTVWGATPDEVARHYPADDLLPGARLLTRAISVAAPADLTWRWLCQIALAPYSYDWIDNRGRRSPQTLTPGADRLELGQTMAVVFTLRSFDEGHRWTALTTPRGQLMFGPVAMTYAAEPDGAGSRIVCRLAVSARGPAARLRGHALAWGDLVMMRRQLLNLKALAERDSRPCLSIHGGAGRRPDHALAALPTLRRRPVCARAGALPARAWTTPASTSN
jgi:hypothetical protein